MKQKILSLLIAASFSSTAFASNHDHSNHASQAAAPLGVMGEHIHPEGDWMVSFKTMSMDMDGNRTGSDRVSTPLAGYMVSPLNMDMNMHMLGAMYGYSDKITIMSMLPIVDISMNHVINMGPMMGNTFTTESFGLGDIKISALYQLNNDWILQLGFSLPTGSIDETDATGMSAGSEVQLPYPMQIGSGTYDFLPGITYIHNNQGSSWGAQTNAVLRSGENDNNYTLGNRYQFTSWYAHKVTNKLSASIRINLEKWNNIDGADPAASVNPTMVPTADTNLRAGKRADILLGMNYSINQQYDIAFEYGVPAYQNLAGPQLETDKIIQLGLEANF
jgi:Putative MetA-pathway of phenol degradation